MFYALFIRLHIRITEKSIRLFSNSVPMIDANDIKNSIERVFSII